MNHNEDDNLFIRKMNDKATHAFHNNYPVFTEFLDLNEQKLLSSHIKELPPVDLKLFGGFDDSERKIACFYPKDYEGVEIEFPISRIKIEPLSSFFSDSLSHRDFLGAILNLGIKRYKIGDILCMNSCTYVFCVAQITPFILDNLSIIKNTTVNSTEIEANEEVNYTQNYDVIKGTVSSLRLDSLVKLGFSLSRGNSLDLIKASRVFINSRLIEKASSNLSEGDVVSVRGLGKIKLHAIGELTKKGRTYIEIYKYK